MLSRVKIIAQGTSQLAAGKRKLTRKIGQKQCTHEQRISIQYSPICSGNEQRSSGEDRPLRTRRTSPPCPPVGADVVAAGPSSPPPPGRSSGRTSLRSGPG